GAGRAEHVGVLEIRRSARAPADDTKEVRANALLAPLVDGVADRALAHECGLALGDIGRLGCAEPETGDSQHQGELDQVVLQAHVDVSVRLLPSVPAWFVLGLPASGQRVPLREEATMRVKTALYASVAIGLLAAGFPAQMNAQQPPAQPAAAVAIDGDDIGGIVTSRVGPEAGVWVIAETTELGTRFAKMVVTDDAGRYVIPDLPAASYRVWVRGYGLVDSPRVTTARGRIVNLTAVPAPSAKEAAEYYPAIYWFSMLKIPDRSLFPGTGPDGNGMPVAYRTQEQWLNAVQLNGCGNCHQLGDKATRAFPEALEVAGRSSIDAWTRRLQSGPGGGSMVRFIGLMNTNDGGHLKRLAEWTDRIRAGELPASVPPRPLGVERNLVVTVYDWLSPK